MPVGARSPSCRRSVIASARVDSASSGRNELDSFSSASVYLPGRLKARAPKSTRNHAPKTTNFVRRPATKEAKAFISTARYTGRDLALVSVRLPHDRPEAGVIRLAARAGRRAP